MASKTFDSQSYNGRYIRLSLTESDQDPITNKSKVNWSVSVNGASGTWYSTTVYLAINGTKLLDTAWQDPPSGVFPMVNGTSQSGTMTVTHDTDGSKDVTVTFKVAIFSRTAESHGGTFTLDPLDRTAPAVTQNAISSIGVDRITISASTTVNCDRWDYSIDAGSTWTNFSTTNGTSASKTITGLSANTTYNVLIRARKTLNQIYGTSASKSAKTLGAATISSAAAITLGSACSVKWKPLDASHKFKLTFTVGSEALTTGYISPGSTSDYTYTSYTPAVADFAAAFPSDSVTASMKITLTTYTSGNTAIGTSTKTVTATMPETSGTNGTKPKITSLAVSESSSQRSGFKTSGNDYLPVKGLSKIAAAVTAAGQYGAKIKTIYAVIDGKTYSASGDAATLTKTLTSAVIKTYGTLTISVTAKDSRGFISEATTATIYVSNYYAPSGTIKTTVSGTTVTTTSTWKIAPVPDAASGGTDQNTRTVKVIRKKLSTGTTTTHTISTSGYTGTDTWTQTGISDVDTETYEYELVVQDKRGANYAAHYFSATGVIAISRLGGGKGVSFFGSAEEEGFWIVNSGKRIRHDITAAEYLELARLLACDYSTSASYYVGQFARYNNNIYECKTAISSGETWTSGHWTLLGTAS